MVSRAVVTGVFSLKAIKKTVSIHADWRLAPSWKALQIPGFFFMEIKTTGFRGPSAHNALRTISTYPVRGMASVQQYWQAAGVR